MCTVLEPGGVTCCNSSKLTPPGPGVVFAQMLVDPHARTIVGFSTLIQKECGGHCLSVVFPPPSFLEDGAFTLQPASGHCLSVVLPLPFSRQDSAFTLSRPSAGGSRSATSSPLGPGRRRFRTRTSSPPSSCSSSRPRGRCVACMRVLCVCVCCVCCVCGMHACVCLCVCVFCVLRV